MKRKKELSPLLVYQRMNIRTQEWGMKEICYTLCGKFMWSLSCKWICRHTWATVYWRTKEEEAATGSAGTKERRLGQFRLVGKEWNQQPEKSGSSIMYSFVHTYCLDTIL